MGWDGSYNWTTKAIAVKDILAELGSKAIAHHGVRAGLWVVVEDNGQRELVCVLLEKHGSHFMQKWISESMGPYDYDCPAHLVDMVPEPTDTLAGYEPWRSRWRKAQAAKAAKVAKRGTMQIGESVSLTNGWTLQVTSVKPLLGSDAKGKVWKIPQRMIVAG